MPRDSDLVVVISDPYTSERDRHLRRAEALSHAARVSHARRREHSKTSEARDQARGERFVHHMVHSQTPLRAQDPEHNPQPSFGSLQYGNSDPFDSMSIPITPESSYLLFTWKQHYENNLNCSTRWLTQCDVIRDFSFESAFHKRCLIFASSTALLLKFPDHPHLISQRLESRSQCFEELHRLMTTEDERLPIAELANSLLLLVIGLVSLDEVNEAKRYVQHLQYLLSSLRTYYPQMPTSMLSRLYYHDWLAALNYLRPLLLDTNILIRDWNTHLGVLHQITYNHDHGSNFVTYPMFTTKLANLFERLQAHINVHATVIADGSLFLDQLLTSSIADIVVLSGELLDHWKYSQRVLVGAQSGIERFGWFCESLATLCAVTFLACAALGPTAGRSRGRSSMRALRYLLENGPSINTTRSYQYLQLWAYYLGAIWEHECGVMYSGTWYTDRLQQEVRELRLTSWADLKNIVDRFLRVPPMQNPGGVWLPGMNTVTSGTQTSCRTDQGRKLEEIIFV